MGFCPLLQNLPGSQLTPPMHDRDEGRVPRQVQSLLQCAVAAADDDDLFIPEKMPVAGGAIRNAAPGECLLAGDFQLSGRRARRDDDRIRQKDFLVGFHAERAFFQRNINRLVEENFRAEAFRLLMKIADEFLPAHALRESGVVFNRIGFGNLPAQILAGKYYRREIRARGVKRGGQPGGTGADNQHFDASRGRLCHPVYFRFCRYSRIATAAFAPSPTATAICARLFERTSPAAKMPGTEVFMCSSVTM